MRGIWFANVSNYLLSWTYAKAIWNVLLSKVHIKQKAGFKATEKTGAGAGGDCVGCCAELCGSCVALNHCCRT